jgi:glycerol uptake facilitator protein
MDKAILGEFIGTAFLLLFGAGVVANVLTKNSKGGNSGWIVITVGWAMAVFIGVFIASKIGGTAHLNPAVTLALAFNGSFQGNVVLYIVAQMAGAITGALLTWAAYAKHLDETEDASLKLAVFSTAPQYRNVVQNLTTEAIGTFALVFGALHLSGPEGGLGSLDALPVALLVLGIGLSLGGPTGYAINPARDLGPRIAHFLLPIKGKQHSDWSYAWIPVAGPVLGGLAAAVVFGLIA